MSEPAAAPVAKAPAYAGSDRARKKVMHDELVKLTGRHRDFACARLRDALKLNVVKARPPRGRHPAPRDGSTTQLLGQEP